MSWEHLFSVAQIAKRRDTATKSAGRKFGICTSRSAEYLAPRPQHPKSAFLLRSSAAGRSFTVLPRRTCIPTSLIVTACVCRTTTFPRATLLQQGGEADVLLPASWSAAKRNEYKRAAVDENQWGCLAFAMEKSDIQEHCKKPLMPIQLRMFAAKVYG